MSGSFLTHITVEHVYNKEAGRESALRKFVFAHDSTYKDFCAFRSAIGRIDNLYQRCEHIVEDMNAFIKTLDNLRIIEERPKIVEVDGLYHINVEYVIEQI